MEQDREGEEKESVLRSESMTKKACASPSNAAQNLVSAKWLMTTRIPKDNNFSRKYNSYHRTQLHF